MSLTAHLKAHVYPKLDAVAGALLDPFHPRNEGERYRLDCPKCGGHDASYEAGASGIQCRACGQYTSLWDMLLASGRSDRDIPALLATAAGVPLPARRGATPKPPPTVVATDSPSSPTPAVEVIRVLKAGIDHSDSARRYLIEERGWSEAEIAAAPLGYYPSARIVADRLRQRGIDASAIEAWGVLSAAFEQRVVGWWMQPDGGLRLWSLGFGATAKSGFQVQAGANRTLPCYWHSASRTDTAVVLVTQPLDAARLIGNGIAAAALGAQSVTVDQAPFLAVTETPLVYWSATDGSGQGGAERSVMRLAALGKSLDCFLAPDAWRSPEHALAAVGSAGVRTALSEIVPGGVFLARRLASQIPRGEGEKLLAKGRQWKRVLMGRTRDEFDAELARQGVAIGLDVAEACRLAAALLDAGIDVGPACETVERRCGIRLRVDRRSDGPIGA